MKSSVFVIGSGPAGIACAYPLVKKGFKVTMLDGGLELEPSRAQILQEMTRQKPGEWSKEALAMIRENMTAKSSGIPLKRVYGSDYPYRDTQEFIGYETEGFDAQPSLAKGGLSNVWGATMLPLRQHDIEDWPIGIKELEPHYRSVLSFVDLAARKDGLETSFPLYTEHYQRLEASRQAEELLADLRNNQGPLAARGINFGYSRLAVRVENSEKGPGCVYCGLCMYGCPYHLIYSSASHLRDLLRHPNFTYIPQTIVSQVIEGKEGVAVLAYSRAQKLDLKYQAEAVYLACGVMSSTKIILQSLQAFHEKLTLKDSQYFLFPLLRFKKTKDVLTETLHTLSQVFIEMTAPEIAAKGIHLQVYSYNDLIPGGIRQALGVLYPIFRGVEELMLGRLLVVQGYLPSENSSDVSVWLEKGTNHTGTKLCLEAVPKTGTKKNIQAVLKKLALSRNELKAVPLTPLLRLGSSGRGFHSGGTFPMSRSPGKFECDVYGRPSGFKRVSVVDASVFPSIPAGSITLSVMANAHRIASHHEELDRD